jgi:two-component system, OmpR family, sensor histidine kinase KdpD
MKRGVRAEPPAARYASRTDLPEAVTQSTRTVAAEHLDEHRITPSVVSDPAWRFSPERVLVCVGATPFADRLIRTGRTVASTLDAELVVIHVEATDLDGPSHVDRQRLSEAFELARRLGGQVETVRGRSVANEIIRYAREHNVVKIVVGRAPQPPLLRVLRPSIADRLARQVGTIDLYVISTAAAPSDGSIEQSGGLPRRRWMRYGLTVVVMVAVTAAGLPLRAVLSPANLVMPYLMAAIVIALRWGQSAAIVGSVIGALLFDFSFITPYFTFAVTDVQYLITLLGMLAVSLVTSALAGQVRAQADAAAERANHTAVLYSLSRSLAVVRSADHVFQVLERHIRETFHRRVAILLPDNETLTIRFSTSEFVIGDEGRSIASEVFRTGRPSELERLSESRYYPLLTSRGTVGVIGLQTIDPKRTISVAELRLLEAVATQAASAIERELLAEKARQAQLLEETDRLQQALLNSISHNLRTPLASITGALSSLVEDSSRLDENARHDLVETAAEEAARLNRLVGNLLDMTRLEAQAMRIHIEPCDVQDVIGAALAQLGDQGRKRSIAIDAPASLPLVPMDFVLITQTLVNLLDNALKYSPPDAPITVRAEARDRDLDIVVTDGGIGIPAGDLDRVFEKFYRGPQRGVTGSGLGLSICKGFVEAHGGRIRAETQPTGGTSVRLTLPLRPTQRQTLS